MPQHRLRDEQLADMDCDVLRASLAAAAAPAAAEPAAVTASAVAAAASVAADAAVCACPPLRLVDLR